MIHTMRLFCLAILVCAMSSLAQAAGIFMIDVDSTVGGSIGTAPGWTSLDATGGNGSSAVVDGTTFTVFSAASNGSRNRNAPNLLTQDFAFDDGASAAVGLTVTGLPAGLYQASVWSWDETSFAGDQIIGIVDFNGAPLTETIFTTNFPGSPTDPFTFMFDSSDFADGFGIFTRENNGNNRARFNALQLVLTPEPSTIAIWSLLGVVGLAFGWKLRRRARA